MEDDMHGLNEIIGINKKVVEAGKAKTENHYYNIRLASQSELRKRLDYLNNLLRVADEHKAPLPVSYSVQAQADEIRRELSHRVGGCVQ
jgi:phage-related protein